MLFAVVQLCKNGWQLCGTLALKIDEYYIQCGCTMDTKQVYFEWHCDWSFINLLFERVKTPQL